MTAVATPQVQEAERQRLAAAIAARPQDAQLRRALAVLLAKSGEARPALEQYRAVLRLVPNDPDAAADAGVMSRRCGLVEEVLPLVRAAAAANPRHARLWQVLGLLHRELEDLAPAIEAFARAAQLAPRDRLIAHSLARAHLEGGLEAAELFERAHGLAPTDSDVLEGWAAALFAERRVAEAIALLDEQLRRHPGWLPGHRIVCRLRWMEGDRERFTESFEAALKVAPREVAIWREYAETLMHAELYDRALDIVARGRAAAGDNPSFLAAETVARAERGETSLADRLFAAMGKIGHITMAVRYVRHLLRSGRPEEAVRVAEARLRDDPQHLLWPYLSAGWRLLGDPRWEWLEGDPRLVGVYDLAAEVGSLEGLAERLRQFHVAVHQPLEQSLRGGTQTDGKLFRRIEPEIRSLRRAIKAAVEAHVAQLPPADPAHPTLGAARGPIRFSGSWSVRLTSGGRHANHIHPQGWLSSAFYVALPPEDRRGPPPAGWLTLGEVSELGLDLPPFRMVEPKPGRLVLFPSTMWHGTRPFEAGERLTVAFDVARPPQPPVG